MDIWKEYGFETVNNDPSSGYDSSENPLDVVILLDLSGSMYTRDFIIEKEETVIGRIKDFIESDISESFVSKIKGKEKISRYEGALFGIILYFLYKIERGSDDRISIIPFSDKAEVIKFGKKPSISPSNENINSAVDEFIKTVEEFMRNRTKISSSLNKSIELMKGFEKNRMKMIVLITDRKSDDKFRGSKKSLQDIIDKRLSPREDLVVNTIGLGDEVDDELLNFIASKTDGEYRKTNSLRGLFKAFSHFSTSTSEKASIIFKE
uniref:Protein containing von Willebrand factor, type A domain protein n=1 Tax=uncultured organism TaxID=155900 RepID=M1P1U2_9ZZZZ|nr:protein containing von Willebrand factor, type A domain protein [uncultured organism]